MTTFARNRREVKAAPALRDFFPRTMDVQDIDAEDYQRWQDAVEAYEAELDMDDDMMSDAEADAMAARWADNELTDRIAHGAMPC